MVEIVSYLLVHIGSTSFLFTETGFRSGLNFR